MERIVMSGDQLAALAKRVKPTVDVVIINQSSQFRDREPHGVAVRAIEDTTEGVQTTDITVGIHGELGGI